MSFSTNGLWRVVLTLLLVGASCLSTSKSSAALITVVDETFDGYNDFPNAKPPTDLINFGVPLVSEGADSPYWLGARIEDGANNNGANSVSTDVGVQEIGSIYPGENSSHVGRVGDDAGLILRLDLTGLFNVTLDFDWRTYQQEADDEFVVAYYVGDGTEFQPSGLGNPNMTYDWGGDPDLGNGDYGPTGWYATEWTELLRAGPSELFTSESFSIPGNDIVYILFWNDDNSNVDFGKFDNVVVQGYTVPEPSSLLLMGLGLIAACVASRRSR